MQFLKHTGVCGLIYMQVFRDLPRAGEEIIGAGGYRAILR